MFVVFLYLKKRLIKTRIFIPYFRNYIFLNILFFLLAPYAQAIAPSPSQESSSKKPLFIWITGNKQENKNSISYYKIISASELKKAGIHNLAQALEWFSGLQIQDSSGNRQHFAVSLRGFGANAAQNSLILLDGVPISNFDIASPEIAMLPIEDIDHIEIIWGSEGVRYGDQAVGGVVKIFTKKVNKYPFRLQGTLGNPLQNKLYINASKLQRHWRLYQSGEIFTVKSGRNHSRDETGRAFGQATYDDLTSQFNFSYLYSQEYQLFPGALTDEQIQQNRHESQNNADYGRSKILWLHFREQSMLNPHWDLINNSAIRLQNNDVFLQAFLNQERENFWLKPELEGHWHYLDIDLAQEFKIDDYNLKDSWNMTQATAAQWSPFLLADFNLTPNLQIEWGGRYAQLSQHIKPSYSIPVNQSVWVSTAAIRYHFTSHLLGYLRRDTNYRFPKIDEEIFTPINSPGLKTQRGISYESGIQYYSNNFLGDLELFQLDLNNEIAFDPIQNALQPFGANRNLDPTRRQGLQLQTQFALAPTIQMKAGWTYTQAHFRSGEFSENTIPFVAKNIVSLQLNRKWQTDWLSGLELRYLSKRYLINDNLNQTAIPPVALVNTFITYNKKLWQMSFRINNLTNHHYNDLGVWQTSNATAYYYPAAGRSYWFTMSYCFI